jgi:hypothetical protein
MNVGKSAKKGSLHPKASRKQYPLIYHYGIAILVMCSLFFGWQTVTKEKPERALDPLYNPLPMPPTSTTSPRVGRGYRLMRELKPMNPVGKNLTRFGTFTPDDGYALVDSFHPDTVVYSIGVGYTVKFDEAIAARGFDVFMYDHTVSKPDLSSPRLHFFKTGICGSDCSDKRLKNIRDMLKDNGHQNKEHIIFKIDPEGIEMDVFEDIPESILNRFDQIVVEYHRITDAYEHFPAYSMERIIKIFKKLNRSHQVVHVHSCNAGNLDVVDGTPVPRVIEVTYLKREGNQFEKCTHSFPVEGLDLPTITSEYDHYLGHLGLIGDD